MPYRGLAQHSLGILAETRRWTRPTVNSIHPKRRAYLSHVPEAWVRVVLERASGDHLGIVECAGNIVDRRAGNASAGKSRKPVSGAVCAKAFVDQRGELAAVTVSV